MEKKINSGSKTPEKIIPEPLYTVSELAENAEKVFGKGVRKECVVAAFRYAGKVEATKEEAKKIVLGFLKKEVK